MVGGARLVKCRDTARKLADVMWREVDVREMTSDQYREYAELLVHFSEGAKGLEDFVKRLERGK